MYIPLRTLHITLGLLATPVFVLYLVSTAQFIFPSLRPGRGHHEQTVQLRCSPDDVLGCAAELSRDHGIEGGVVSTATGRSGRFLEIVRGSQVHEVLIGADGTAQITSTNGGVRDLFVGMHSAAGLWHAHGPTRLWGYLVLVSGAAMLSLLVSGVLMWLKRPRERKLGTAFLALSLIWGLGSLLAIRLSG